MAPSCAPKSITRTTRRAFSIWWMRSLSASWPRPRRNGILLPTFDLTPARDIHPRRGCVAQSRFRQSAREIQMRLLRIEREGAFEIRDGQLMLAQQLISAGALKIVFQARVYLHRAREIR